MDKMTVVYACDCGPEGLADLETFHSHPLVTKIVVWNEKDPDALPPFCVALSRSRTDSESIFKGLLMEIDTPYLLVLLKGQAIRLGPRGLERLVEVAQTSQAGLVYSDCFDLLRGETREHPLNDYQLGSIRDDFDFGAMVLLSASACRLSLSEPGALGYSFPSAFYDLRLRVSLSHPVFHIREFLYSVEESEGKDNEDGHFAYLDPQRHSYQKELEGIATDHLRRLNAYLEPEFDDVPPARQTFLVEASVIIPVKNRVQTIAEALSSALTQKTDFPVNVIVVDNHSSDGTTARLEEMAKKESRLRHLMPERHDLSIGGCWNEAIYSKECGRFAVQLDSDDLYISPSTLQRLIDELQSGKFAMVIGAYTVVNDGLAEIPPGLIDHREWTEDNGRNNALRINGLGAPRAFNTEIARRFGFLNVGYGEDYAMALRISRHYRIGRIYDSLYLCRRWAGNSDAALSVIQKNRYDAFKDQIRTLEIMARQQMNKKIRVGAASCRDHAGER